MLHPGAAPRLPASPTDVLALQRVVGNQAVQSLLAPVNRTGLPDALKAGVEALSGYSLDDVRVHRNSGKPAQVQAHAYAQGTDIHLAPGQERHLPHEAWHVVQQKQGRVQASAQLESGVPINDDAGLEREADVMGARAWHTPARLAPPPEVRPVPPGESPVQGIWVKTNLVYSGKVQRTVYVPTKKNAAGARDTRAMTPSDREQVYEDLKASGKYPEALAALEKEIKESSKGTAEEEVPQANVDPPVTDEDVTAYRADMRERGTWGSAGEARAVATAFNFSCRLMILDEQERYVLAATIGLGNEGQRALLNVGNHYEVVSNAAKHGERYKESHVLHKVPPDGDCLFSALHYVAANGTDKAVDPNPTDAALTTLTLEQFITRARQIAADPDTGVTREEIRQSMMELRLSGGFVGVGPRLARRMNLQSHDSHALRKQLAHIKGTESGQLEKIKAKSHKPGSKLPSYIEKFGTLGDLLDAYDVARKKLLGTPRSTEEVEREKRERQVVAMDELANVILEVVAEHRPSIEAELVTSVGQDPKVEHELRRDSTGRLRHSGFNMDRSPYEGSQFIITKDGAEYVMDRIGQLVPRFVDRGISSFNQFELREENKIFPTKRSPIPNKNNKKYSSDLRHDFAKQTSTAASGIGSNHLKASDEMLHVEGMKPSPFMSVTSIAGGTVNPQGGSFGSALYTIDLAHLPPTAIAAIYTDRGMGYYLLSAFQGEKDEKKALISAARGFEKRQSGTLAEAKKKPSTVVFSATDAEKENPTLSGKEWQALMDVVRTGEVLISAPIPEDAMKKK